MKGKDKDLLGFDPFPEHCSDHSFELNGDECGPSCSAGALLREGVPLYRAGCWWDLIFRPVTLVFTALPQWRKVLQHESALSWWFGAILSSMAIGKGFFCTPSLWKYPNVKYFSADVSVAPWGVWKRKGMSMYSQWKHAVCHYSAELLVPRPGCPTSRFFRPEEIVMGI